MTGRTKLSWPRPRFSLAALLVLITVVAIPLGYVAQRRSWNLRRKAVCELLERRGVILNNYELEDGTPPAKGIQQWLRRLFLDDAAPPVLDICYDPALIRSEKLPLEDGEVWRPLNDRDLESLAYLPELSYVELHSIAECSDEGLKALSRLPKLESLAIYSAPHLTGSFLRELRGGKRFEELRLIELLRFQGENLEFLHRCEGLRFLRLERCPLLTDASLRNANASATLETLSVEHCPLGDETIRRWLVKCRLTSLTLLNTKISSQSASAIGSQRLVEDLHIANAPLEDEDFRFLEKWNQLRNLRLDAMPVRGEVLRWIAGDPGHLHTLSLRATLFDDEHFSLLRRYRMLGFLDIGWTPISGERFSSIHGLKRLTWIELSGTQFSDRGKSELAALKNTDDGMLCTMFSPNAGLPQPHVIMPLNWKVSDFERFPERYPAWSVVVTPSVFKEVERLEKMRAERSLIASSERRGGDFAPRIDHAPAELMGPVIRLYELAEVDPKVGAREEPGGAE